MDRDGQTPRRHLRWIVPTAAVGAFLALIAINLSKTHLSTQVRSTIEQVESSPVLGAELGAPVHVERFGPLPLRRYTLRERDADVLSYRARVRGSRASGELEMLVSNENDQGWAGTYFVRTAHGSVLRDGAYVQAPSRELIQGRFDRDGRALPATAVPAETSPTP